MLGDSFYFIKEFTDTDSGRTYRLALNASHPIFQAHFAGNPIMPGACVVQTIKELVADYFGKAFFVCTVKNMKFLHAVNPQEFPEISVQLACTQQENDRVSVSAVLNDGQTVFSKSVLMMENI